MAQTPKLLRSLRTLTKKRLTLKAMERRLDAEERKVMDARWKPRVTCEARLFPARPALPR